MDGLDPTEILDQKLSGRQHALLVLDPCPAILEDLLGGRIKETDAVVVANPGLAGNDHLGIVDSGLVGQIDRGWELLDRLLGGYRPS